MGFMLFTKAIADVAQERQDAKTPSLDGKRSGNRLRHSGQLYHYHHEDWDNSTIRSQPTLD